MEQSTRIRKRVPKSCRRCHRRKQRCIGFPTCANCNAANEPCLRPETSLSWHHGMSKGALAHRIEVLEAHLSATIHDGLPSPDGAEAGEEEIRSPEGTTTQSAVLAEEQAASEESRGGKRARPKPAATPYFGPSSGVTITEHLSRIVGEDVTWADRSILVHGTEEQEGPISPAPTTEQGKAAPPDDAVGKQLLDAYFNNLHKRLPFLDRAEILQLHLRRHDARGAGAITSGGQQHEYGMFKLFMVYAIGAAMLQLSDQHESMTPNAYFATALQFDGTAVREALSIAGVEGRMLMVIYQLRSKSSSSVWFAIGMAMRICIDLGMHRESHYRELCPQEAQLHRKLFWSVYVIERHVSWCLGRPFSIAEDDIDTQILPDADDSSIAVQPGRFGLSANTNIPVNRRFIATVQLQRVMSRIHTKLYGVDRNISALAPQLPSLLALLEEYKTNLPSLEPRDYDFMLMHWNNCVRVLLQPFLGILDPDDEHIRTCLHASGQMCQIFKRSQQRGISGFSFLLANSVYLAGLTMCFCLFRSPRSWTTSVANDLRACSSAIFVTAERIPSFRNSRDELENMINRTMDFIHETSTTSQHVSSQPVPWVEGQFTNIGGSLDLQNMGILETQGQENSLFGDFFTEDLWTAETLSLPTLDLFGLDWNGQAYQQ
ncbi:fungal-specific transcription factor domain-containing protein [Aspergillus pseudodeflectus]|uniref:Fungal-specific transcription factor domain-containing protein n=1 Tax=Aspergillus pseudodeflectus TaxID=176178 RepID=A0ABR4JR44_9EURO